MIDVPPVSAADLDLPRPSEDSAAIAARVAQAREVQRERYSALPGANISTNAEADGEAIERFMVLDTSGRALLVKAMDAMKLSARGYTRILRVSRTLADLDGAEEIKRHHIAEALAYRRPELVR